jgi:hypothetical protein
MKKKLAFMFILALLLVPCTVAYAYDDAAAATGPVVITSPESGSLPQFNVYGNAIGGVTPGEIFFIDTSSSDADTIFTLYITNADELVHSYRYMTLNIGIYVQDGTGAWEKVPTGADENSRGIYLTMQNGSVSFVLAGGASYKITVEKGCFYCYGLNAERKYALPDFYLTVS